MKLTNDEIIALVRDEIQQAQGYDSDVLSSIRAGALDYYHGNMNNAPIGRSNVVSYDVADTVHALMSQSGEIFRASSVEFDADNEDDEDQAQLESDFIKRVMEQNDEYTTMDGSVFDAMLQGNGWIEVQHIQDTTTTTESYENVTIEEATYLVEPNKPNQEVETVELIQNGSTEDGQQLVSFKIKRHTTTNTLDINSISPDVMLFSKSADQFKLNEIRFLAKRFYMTTGDLIDAGLTKDEANAVPEEADEYWEASVAREGQYEDSAAELSGNQEATKLKETYICYMMLDINNDGHAERYMIHIAGQSLVELKVVAWIPFVTGSPLPLPHRIRGQGMYEVMKEVQDSKTGILRAYMDNLKVLNKGRVGYLKGEVDMDELLDGRVDGAVGMDRPDALFPLPNTDAGSICIQGLNYQDQIRTSRGGSALDLNNSEMQIASSSAAAATREYDSKEKMAGLYCKNLAHTLLKGTFLLVHKTLRRGFDMPMDAKVNGKWVQTNPSEWKERNHATLLAGLTTSEKHAKTMGLQQLIAQLQDWMVSGQEGIITNKGKVYNAACDWIKASHIGQNPEEYLIDPDSEEAQQVAQQQSQQVEQQQQQMAQQQQAILDLQKEIEQMKDATDRSNKDKDIKFKYDELEQNLEIKEAELTMDGIDKIEGETDEQPATID